MSEYICDSCSAVCSSRGKPSELVSKCAGYKLSAPVTMKAITIWQPWASLLTCGAKRYETRSWATNYRGTIAIHASKKLFDTGTYLDRDLHHFADALGLPDIYSFDKLPRGRIISTVELVACHRIQMDPKTHRVALYDNRGYQSSVSLGADELLFGDWTSGRYALEIANIKRLNTPIPAKGKQGLWNWEAVQANQGGQDGNWASWLRDRFEGGPK